MSAGDDRFLSSEIPECFECAQCRGEAGCHFRRRGEKLITKAVAAERCSGGAADDRRASATTDYFGAA